MVKIVEQVEELKTIFDTGRIIDKCSKASLTNNEFEDIIEVIKTDKIDGDYEISDDIMITLHKGNVIISDCE